MVSRAQRRFGRVKRSTMTEIALTTDHLAFVRLTRKELTCLQ